MPCVASSGFSQWLLCLVSAAGQPARHQRHQEQLDKMVREAFVARRGRSGSPRLTLDLADTGHGHNRKDDCQQHASTGLESQGSEKFKATTNSRHDLSVAPNLLNMALSGCGYWPVFAPGCGLGHVRAHDSSTGLWCFTDGSLRHQRPTGVIVHSDRGSQYCSSDYKSCSRTTSSAAAWAPKVTVTIMRVQKGSFHSLKVEAIQGERFSTRQEMRQNVFRIHRSGLQSKPSTQRQRLYQPGSVWGKTSRLGELSTVGGQDYLATIMKGLWPSFWHSRAPVILTLAFKTEALFSLNGWSGALLSVCYWLVRVSQGRSLSGQDRVFLSPARIHNEGIVVATNGNFGTFLMTALWPNLTLR